MLLILKIIYAMKQHLVTMGWK